ncbi:asparagine synthase-related protein [Streptomyces sp. Z26]|uniref:asparagine synthase-related protein n=1 Tax=Streptomyces sp. Z26 TaxID=2500177 RepID=UPI000EF169C2|nr:asparagine synthase-related protein [Streptomyces sp. Z26]RLL69862.1 asparagine synthase [Streptomyces sp. Z26]
MRTGFVVLPDVEYAEYTADAGYAANEFDTPRVFAYPSGRPWVVGDWAPGTAVRAEAGPVRVVVIGFCPVTTARLTGLAARVRTSADVDALAGALRGSFHLVVAVGAEQRVQGTVSGLRQVFHARSGGHTVVADRPDVLASLTGAAVDERLLAARVVCGGRLPPPLRDRSMWAGVSTVAHDSCLLVGPEGVREVRRWHPPAPELPLARGASAVREALLTSVADQAPAVGRLSADLSGGMDSASLCFLAARTSPSLLTVRWAEAEAGNDDAFFAAHCAERLPLAEHLVVPQEGCPTVFAEPDAASDAEQPYLFPRMLARVRHTAELLARHGARTHLAGHGADELFGALPGYLHPLLRRHPYRAVRRLRAHRALGRWPLGPTVRELVRGGGVGDWWRAQADQLTDPPPARRLPPLGWGMPLRAPVWATDAAVDAAREVLREAAEDVRPFAADRGQHQFLTAVRTTAPAYRQLGRLFGGAGVGLRLPFLDDRVVTAALSVRLDARVTPWRYKPLLADAMRDIVPEAVLRRDTKGDFSEDLRVGRKRNMPAVEAVFADSTLASRGLISVDALRTALRTPQTDLSRDFALDQLLGCETWARTAHRHPRLPGGKSAPQSAS